MISLSELKKDLKDKTKKVVIVSHRSPDGDSIGSSLGVHHFLVFLGHDSTVITPDQAPAFLEWMPGFDQILNFEKNKEESESKVADADIVFCLDFNTLGRTGAMEDSLKSNTQATFINIDHHQDPDNFADFQLSDTSASSTAQLVYGFVNEILDQSFLSKDFAACIYTGILTDTGSFRFSSTSAETHKITAELLELGADPTFIHSKVFDSYSPDRLKLLGFALHEKLILLPKYKTAIIALTERELRKFNFQKGDTEGLVNFPLSIKDVRLAILITEKDRKVKMSFRSKGDFAVNLIAGEYFSGGGHKNAAGGISDVSVARTVKKIKNLLPQYEESLNS